MKQRVAVYARVSSDQQAEAGTVASQVAALKERVESDGLELDESCCFVDEGYSGASLVRPGLEGLRDAASAGMLDRVYVHAPDRLARNYAYQVLLVDEFRRCGVELVFLTNQALGSTPEENLLLQVQGMVAEYERAKILERSRRGKLHAARGGSVNVLSGAPYGYRYVNRQEGTGQARYEIDFERAPIVRQIFEWVGVERASIAEVSRRLGAQGVASYRGKKHWDRATVWGILKNPAYKGSAAFGKTRQGEARKALRPQRGARGLPAHSAQNVSPERWISIAVPALISEGLFEGVQKQLEENRRRNRQHRRGARHLLQGLTVCQRCGYAYYGKPVSRSSARGKQRSYVYYRCTGTDAYRFGGQRMCENKQVRSDLIEQAVWEDVAGLLRNPQRIEAEYRRRLENRTPHAARDEQKAAIQKLERSIARLVDAYSEGLLEKAEFEPRIKHARERLRQMQEAQQASSTQESEERELALVVGRLQEFAARVKEGLNVCTWSVRRDIIRALVRRVEIGEESVRVVYRISPDPFEGGPDRGQRPVSQHCWRRDHTSLRGPRFRLPPSADHHLAPLIRLMHRYLQPTPDQPQHLPVRDPPFHRSHELVMRYGVEVLRQVGIHHLGVAGLQAGVDVE
jgi:site-specific DNA recombinase